MSDTSGKAILLQLKQAWIGQRLLVAIMLSGAIFLLGATLLYTLFSISFYQSIPALVLIFVSYSIASRWWKLDEWEIARYLNQTQPTLQESADLVLQPVEKLTGLQRLQQQKVAAALAQLKPLHPSHKSLKKAVAVLLFVLLISALLIYLSGNYEKPTITASSVSYSTTQRPALPPEVKSLQLTITPPAYTGKPARTQAAFDLQIEEGGSANWVIKTTTQPEKMHLVFNDGAVLLLQNKDQKSSRFSASKVISKSGFYQLKIGDSLSELYKIETIKDKAPTVAIQTPKPATTVEFGQSQIIPLQVFVNDDYGVKSAIISATVSSGEGEAVKFKQQALSFNNFSIGKRQQTLQSILNLKALGMEPGNELYFFVTAIDSRNQETKSDVHIVTLEDTAVESSMDGMMNGLDVKPDLFRSERQIIIETEQLLQDRTKISVENFQKKSDDLGVDQKLLRLRYGKFLGEETDTEIGGHEHQDDHKNGTDGAAEILEQYGHSHDNAEDATFFDAATKKQLKETLAEMWKAELQLRTYKPKEALVFEYKALRLLKDLQQKSRAYVAKTGFTPTPLKWEKRLTGELNAIGQPVTQQQFNVAVSLEMASRKAIAELEQLKENGLLQPAQKLLLQQAFQQLSGKAAQAPAQYLPALSALRKILNENFRLHDITTAENGLQKMLNPPTALPSATILNGSPLSTQYFKNLSGGNPRK